MAETGMRYPERGGRPNRKTGFLYGKSSNALQPIHICTGPRKALRHAARLEPSPSVEAPE